MADPGFTIAYFTALSNVSEKRKKEKEIISLLTIDEMNIQFGVDQIHVDIDACEIENTVATQALFIMVVAINVFWKIPIAY